MATPVLSKVHTFANDLNQARLDRDTKKTAQQSIPTSTTPSPDPQTTASTKKTVPVTKKTSTPLNTDVSEPIKLKTKATRDASYPATIITDKKRRRFSLTKAMSDALSDWWQKTARDVQKRKTPTYSVPVAERRKGVVATATTITGRVTTTDHKEIVARIKTEPSTQAEPTKEPHPPTLPSAKPTVEVAQDSLPSWETAVHTIDLATDEDPIPTKTSFSETLSPLTTSLSEAVPTWETTSHTIDFKIDNEVTPQVTITPKTTNAPLSKPTPQPKQDNETNNTNSFVKITGVEVRRQHIEPIIPNTIEATSTADFEEPEVVSVKPTVVTAPIAPPTPVIPEPVKIFPKIKPILPNIPPLNPKVAPENVSLRRENAFSLLSEVPAPVVPPVSPKLKAVLAERAEVARSTTSETPRRFGSMMRILPYFAGITFVLITIGSIGYFFMSSTSEPIISTTSTELPAIPTTDFSETSWSMTNSPVSAQLDAPNKISLYNTIKNTVGLGDGLYMVTPLAHDSALPLTTREILSLVNRQFTPAFLGTITQVQVGMYREEPVILLTISDEATARGGMFGWERTMSQDLSPWFGVAFRYTSTSTLTGFVDSRSAERDVRILKDDIGTERITYGFLDTSTILITSDTTTFLNIADQDWY